MSTEPRPFTRRCPKCQRGRGSGSFGGVSLISLALKGASPMLERPDSVQEVNRCPQCQKDVTRSADWDSRDPEVVDSEQSHQPASWASTSTIIPSERETSADDPASLATSVLGSTFIAPSSITSNFLPFSMSLGSSQTFKTAQSTISSYATASSGPRIQWTSHLAYLGDPSDTQKSEAKEYARFQSDEFFDLFIDTIFQDIFEITTACYIRIWSFQRRHVADLVRDLHPTPQNADIVTSLDTTVDTLLSEVHEHAVITPGKNVGTTRIEHLKDTLQLRVYQYASTQPRLHDLIPQSYWTGPEVFSSEWMKLLKSRGIIMDPDQALDWSGRGQHAEYTPEDKEEIPLHFEKVLGHSETALVESVICRRIRLARKTIRCNRRLKKEDFIMEVQHLQNLRHSHIIQVVGTYTLRRDLVILLYPAAEWNLQEFLDHVIDTGTAGKHAKQLSDWLKCLSRVIQFVHNKKVKHMDIKPKNLLVRPYRGSHKIYLADFGIARAYDTAEAAFTDTPISYTWTYAAPEVISQDIRGFPADIFSLGCVFAEIIAVIASTPGCNYREQLQDVLETEADGSYQANIEAVCKWLRRMVRDVEADTSESGLGEPRKSTFINCHPSLPTAMLVEAPEKRITAARLSDFEGGVGWVAPVCYRDHFTPEPFEAVEA